MSAHLVVDDDTRIDEVNCNVLTVSGNALVRGPVDSEEIYATGIIEVKGDLVCERLVVSGSVYVDGRIRCEDATVSGHLQGEERNDIDSLSISGSVYLENFSSQKVVGESNMYFEDISASVFEISRMPE